MVEVLAQRIARGGAHVRAHLLAQVIHRGHDPQLQKERGEQHQFDENRRGCDQAAPVADGKKRDD